MPSEEEEYAIRDLAYRLWVKDGSPPGKALEYWFAAERQIRRDTDNDRLEEGLEETFPASDTPSDLMRHTNE